MTIHPESPTARPALFALIGLALIFTAIVGYGWSRMFASWNIPVLPYIAGLLLALVAIVLAYATAAERVQSGKTTSVAAAYFFVLFLISALGTINTLFINFSGITIMRGELATAQEAFTNLKNKTIQLLATEDWSIFEKNVNVKWKALENEIRNPQLCGQGPEALKRIEELTEMLPGFRRLAGGGCGNINQIVSVYDKQIQGLLKSSPEFQKVSKKIALREEIVNISIKVSHSLDEAAKNLTGISNINATKAALNEAAEQYAKEKQTLDSVLTQPSALPNKIDTTTANALGNIGQVVNIVFNRLDDAATYFYILVALMLDIVLVIAFQNVLRVDRQRIGDGNKRPPTYI